MRLSMHTRCICIHACRHIRRSSFLVSLDSFLLLQLFCGFASSSASTTCIYRLYSVPSPSPVSIYLLPPRSLRFSPVPVLHFPLVPAFYSLLSLVIFTFFVVYLQGNVQVNCYQCSFTLPLLSLSSAPQVIQVFTCPCAPLAASTCLLLSSLPGYLYLLCCLSTRQCTG